MVHMIEVELKYRVYNYRGILNRLKDIGAEYVGKEYEVDYYLQHPCRDFKLSDEALRIRVSDSGYFITYKGPRISDRAKTRYEIESKVNDYNLFLELFNRLGFEIYAVIRKTRRIYRYGEIKISLDYVEGLGDFIEVELHARDESHAREVEDTLREFITRLDIDPDKKILKSYLELYLEKHHLR